MSSMILQVEGLQIASHDKVIVDDLSFNISRGEIVTLTGKSGSGKTSIGLAILGLLPQRLQLKNGTIKWLGDSNQEKMLPQDIASWSSLRGKHIGYIQQDVFGIFDPVLRMGKQMRMIVRELTGNFSSDVETELRSKMKEVGIEDIDRIWNSYPHQLSGGQLQRCQICLSIIIKPSLIIADEPTSAIDKSTQLNLLDLLRHVRDEYRIAILCITHEESVVSYLADRNISLEYISARNSSKNMVSISLGDSSVSPVLKVDQLGYAHKFGGLFDSTGARIKGIEFNLQAGQCLGIIGESGSGKSTLAQLLVGLLIPSEGSVSINDRQIDFEDSHDIHLLRSKVQLVMQDGRGSLHPNKTIRWLLQEVVRQIGKSKAENEDFSKLLGEVGLSTSLLDRKENSLSGGECLRISIARALLMEPEILICDESTTSLDVPSRDGIVQLLVSLMQNQQLGLILIAHDDSLIRWVARDIIVLSKGEIVEKGPTQEVLNEPKHPATQKIMTAQATLGKKMSH
ncbi:MAG: ATP-binding cassette domain-containing protein [Saprospiraceae bacterium]